MGNRQQPHVLDFDSKGSDEGFRFRSYVPYELASWPTAEFCSGFQLFGVNNTRDGYLTFWNPSNFAPLLRIPVYEEMCDFAQRNSTMKTTATINYEQ